MTQVILEKIKQAILDDKYVRKINLGYLGASVGNPIEDDYLRYDKDVKVFMDKHYPDFNYTMERDGKYVRWLLIDNKNCQCGDCQTELQNQRKKMYQ